MEIHVKLPQTERRKISIWSIVKMALGLFLVFFVLSKTSLSELSALTAQVSWSWLGLTFVLFLLLSMLKALQYHVLFDTDFPYFQILSVVILQNAISNFVASSAGIAAYLTMLRAEQGARVSRSASVFVLTKIGDLIAIWLALIISLLFVWDQVRPVHNPVLFLITLIGAGLAAFGAIVLLRRRFVGVLRLILNRTGLLKFHLTQRLLGLADVLADFEQKDMIRILLTASGLSCAYLILTFIWSYSSFRSFGFPITIWAVIFVSSMLQIISIIPVQVFGGLGVSEAASLLFFGFFGFSQGPLSAVLVGIRLVFYLSNLAVLLYLPLNTFLLNRSLGNVK